MEIYISKSIDFQKALGMLFVVFAEPVRSIRLPGQIELMILASVAAFLSSV